MSPVLAPDPRGLQQEGSERRLQRALLWLMDRIELDLDHLRVDLVGGMPRYELISRGASRSLVLSLGPDGRVEVQADDPEHAAAMELLLRQAFAA